MSLQFPDDGPKGGVRFDRILSHDTHYGLIWSGAVLRGDGRGEVKCAIKMVLLDSGPHRERATGRYVDPADGNGTHKKVPKCFRRDAAPPFVHTAFARRKSMSPAAFEREATSAARLADLGLGPKVYGRWTASAAGSPVRYAFMASELADGSLKQVLVRRPLRRAERRLAVALILRMHELGIAHRDMKPSNVAAWLDERGRVRRVGAIDCQKVVFRKDVSRRRWRKLVARDRSVFAKHAVTNATERGGRPWSASGLGSVSGA